MIDFHAIVRPCTKQLSPAMLGVFADLLEADARIEINRRKVLKFTKTDPARIERICHLRSVRAVL